MILNGKLEIILKNSTNMLKKHLKKDLSHITKTMSPKNERASIQSHS